MPRVLIERDALLKPGDFFHEDSPWPAKWIGHPEHADDASVVIAYRRQFKLSSPLKCRLHVSADQRYELFIDGQRVGRGPERGDHANWFYETYELEFSTGAHSIIARTWWLSDDAPTPYAQITSRPAFLLLGESTEVSRSTTSPTTDPVETRGGEANTLLSTGVASWECKRLGGYSFVKPQVGNTFLVSGAKLHIDGTRFPWDFEKGAGDGWIDAEVVAKAAIKSVVAESVPNWLLRPALLPPMLEDQFHVGKARHVEHIDSLDNVTRVIQSKNHIRSEAADWNDLLVAHGTLTIPANAGRRVIVDLDDYYCAFPELITRGGAGAVVQILWAESLFNKPDGFEKGNRNDIEGKVFVGLGDAFLPPGGSEASRFETLWWEAGRYLEVIVQTKTEPLTIESLSIRETHYPCTFESSFEASDTRLTEVMPIALRTLKMCSHETYMDCPYYEQLMYVGDTRLQVLTTQVMTRDDRLPRKALEVFDFSRAAGTGGLTMARYPTKVLQTIPPFSLWWIGMLHDHMMWRGDAEFIKARLPGMRAVLDAFLLHINGDNLLESPPGWNFVDWVGGWFHGMPPGAHNGISGTLNWHLIYTLRLAAELEQFVEEPELAARCRKRGDKLSAATEAFWDERRGLFADDLAKRSFSEHTQCLSLLSGSFPTHRQRVSQSLITDTNLSRATIYFRHYLFEVFHQLGRTDLLLDRMNLWFNLRGNGNRTTIEQPEPTRSDCHAWGAHPVYHYFATILGIRPKTPGFEQVLFTPHLGPLTSAKGMMVHPKGFIRIDLQQSNGRLTGEIELPETITGTLIANGATRELNCGRQKI